MQKSLKGLYADVQQFLPRNLFTENGGRKLDVEISAIAIGQKANITRVSSTIVRLIELWMDSDEGKAWNKLAFTYKVPTPLILDGLHKKVIEKVKNKEIVHIKKPKRPSKRIEVLSKLEKNLIAMHETPFDDYKKKMSDLGKEIDINVIRSVREELKLIIQKMWLVVEKFSAPLTKRGTIMLAHLTENERKKINFNKAYIDRLRNENFQSALESDRSAMYTLSPVPILLKCDINNTVDANTIKFTTTYIYIGGVKQEDIKRLLEDFAHIIGKKAVEIEPTFAVRRTKHGGRKAGPVTEFIRPPDEEDSSAEGETKIPDEDF